MNEEIFLLDTPGLLWPKIENQTSAMKLACSGAIKDDILDVAELAAFLLVYLAKNYPESVRERFKVDVDSDLQCGDGEDYMLDAAVEDTTLRRGIMLLEACGKRRGCLLKGGDVDYNRIANIVMDDFRAGRMGRISLDLPEVLKEEEELRARLAEKAKNDPKKRKIRTAEAERRKNE